MSPFGLRRFPVNGNAQMFVNNFVNTLVVALFRFLMVLLRKTIATINARNF